MAAAAAVPVVTAAEKALDALTGDIVVIRGQVFREHDETFYGPDKTPTGRLRKHTKTVLIPVDLELHVNPLGIGLGAAALAAAGLLGVVAWHGISIPLPLGGAVQLFPGIKDTDAGKRLSDRLTPESGDSCEVLHDRWRKLRMDPFWVLNPVKVAELRAIERDAADLDCAWLANP